MSFSVLIDIDAGISSDSASIPNISFDMTEHPMPPLRPTVRRLGAQRFAAQGSLPMPGRWRLQVILPEGRAEILFSTLTQERRP
jgi:hypothetical protein